MRRLHKSKSLAVESHIVILRIQSLIVTDARLRSLGQYDMSTMNPTETERPGSKSTSDQHSPRVAFVSGHIDLPYETLLLHCKDPLDAAIANGENFILSNADSADSMALHYLLSQSVSASRITRYIYTPPAMRQKPGRANDTMWRINQLRTRSEILEHYRKQGFGVRVITGWRTERDAVMTRKSDHDILCVRPDDETKALYRKRYRLGRVSGTQKNKKIEGNNRTRTKTKHEVAS
jgi:hypothetical protein